MTQMYKNKSYTIDYQLVKIIQLTIYEIISAVKQHKIVTTEMVLVRKLICYSSHVLLL